MEECLFESLESYFESACKILGTVLEPLTLALNPGLDISYNIGFEPWIRHFLFLIGSQARGPIRAVAASLHQSHSNMGSKPHLQPTPQLMATPDP